MIGFLRALFAPPSRWRHCRQPTAAERAAQWELRLGQHKAAERLKQAARAQALDARHIVRPTVTPNLPADNVIRMRKRKPAQPNSTTARGNSAACSSGR